jgi:hypothetical protein
VNYDDYEDFILPNIVKWMPRKLKQNIRIVELYSSMGMIGVNIAKLADRIICCDPSQFIKKFNFDKSLSYVSVLLMIYVLCLT